MALAAVRPDVPAPSDTDARILEHADTERYRRLDRLAQYYRSGQHELKRYDWDGRLAPVGRTYGRPYEAVEVPGLYAPLRQRQPATPYHLARVIVDRFTSLLFGESRWPHLKVETDEVADDFVREVARSARLSLRMIQARNVGGATGSVGLSYRWVDGLPRVAVHQPKDIIVTEWRDREELVPAAVVKTTRSVEEEWGAREQRTTEVEWVTRHDWSVDGETGYLKMRVSELKEGRAWQVDPAKSFRHALGFCPFVWLQNHPTDESVDGESDYEPLTDACGTSSVFDQIDILLSSTVKGCVANVDPTLVLGVPRSQVKDSIVKGSQHALVVGKDGDARYLELAGTSIRVGYELVREVVRGALEATSCVLVDPEKISGAAQSGKAIEYIYAPMLARASVLREQYGDAIRQVVDGLRRSARGGKLMLPSRKVVRRDEATQADLVEWAAREPGQLDPIGVDWPPFFEPTPQDRRDELMTAQAATGGKPVISQETALRRVAALFDVDDLNRELDRIRADDELAREGREALFGGAPIPDDESAEHAGETPAERVAHEAAETPEEERAEHARERAAARASGPPPPPDGGAPEAGIVAAAGGAEKAQDVALNGAQVTALVDIVVKTVNGELPRESAIAIITASFPLTREKAEEILGPAGTPAFEGKEEPAPVRLPFGGPVTPPAEPTGKPEKGKMPPQLAEHAIPKRGGEKGGDDEP